jgi:hypothetical protein
MIANLGWGTFLLWGLFDALIAIGSWWSLRETRGLSLEEIAVEDFRRAGEEKKKDIEVDSGENKSVGK